MSRENYRRDAMRFDERQLMPRQAARIGALIHETTERTSDDRDMALALSA
jgi:hypothetical protein